MNGTWITNMIYHQMCKYYNKSVSVINRNVSSSTLVEVTSLPWLRTSQENEEQPWKWKESFTKRKCLRTKATGIHYKMHEIKTYLLFSELSQQGGMAMAFIEEN
jgi:hypothetical protein